MRKKRHFVDGAIYHVTSRTNNKVKIFENRVGRKIMTIILREAKEKFNFKLYNFCIMPTHIHLLIEPAKETGLNKIMQWIKTNSAKSLNRIFYSIDHLWGHRYYARIIKNQNDFETVMRYIDENPVKEGLVTAAKKWTASGAYYRAHEVEF